MKTPSLDQVFRENVPWESVRALAKVIADMYPEAFLTCRQLHKKGVHKAEADNSLWCIRRAKIERGIRDAVSGHSGVMATIKWGRYAPKANPWNSTQVDAGRVFITQCKVDHPDAAPDHSIGRDVNSQNNGQLSFFADHDVKPPKDFRVYATLIHGHLPTQPDRPTFCMIRFLKPGARQWLDIKIDLFQECADIFAHLRHLPIEELAPDERIEDSFNPELNEEKDSQ